MKFVIVTGCALMFGFATFMFNQNSGPADGAQAAVNAAKYAVAEKETAVRPSRFEEMKWHPGDSGSAVELRAPAAVVKGKKK